MKNYIIGVDVGGTNIKLGLLRQNSPKVIARSRLVTGAISTNKSKMTVALIEAIQALMQSNNIAKKDVLGIGIGMPGPINSKEGVVQFLPNIPGWKKVPFARMIRERLKLPAFIDNDVNVITLGEWIYGAGKGQENLVCMTLGTGVGGGLILDGRIYRGENFCAGEIGHMLLKEPGAPKTFEGYGYFEHYVGHKFLVRKAKKTVHKDIEKVPDIFALASKGNRKALKFYKEMGTQIGNVLVNVINLLNPRLIIIGGGVSNNFKFFSKSIEETIQQRAMDSHKHIVKVVRAKLGDDAGIIGAGILVKDSLGVK